MKLLAFITSSVMICNVSLADPIPITFMTWNVENLWHKEGEFLRPKRDGSAGKIRTQNDYDSIAGTIASIDPVVVGLQELGNREAAEKILDSKYELIFSERYIRDKAIKPNMTADPSLRDIYTALAFDANRASLIKSEYVGDLSITEPWSPHKTRAGVAGLFSMNGIEVWVLSIHLKSGCWERNDLDKYRSASYIPLRKKEDIPSNKSYNYAAYKDNSCWLLSKQKDILENWLDRKSSTKAEVVILGDFNRRLNNDGDYFLASINDRDPVSSTLFRSPFNIKPQCGVSTLTGIKGAIDFVLYTQKLFKNRVAITEEQKNIINIKDPKASDHCPAIFSFMPTNLN